MYAATAASATTTGTHAKLSSSKSASASLANIVARVHELSIFTNTESTFSASMSATQTPTPTQTPTTTPTSTSASTPNNVIDDDMTRVDSHYASGSNRAKTATTQTTSATSTAASVSKTSILTTKDNIKITDDFDDVPEPPYVSPERRAAQVSCTNEALSEIEEIVERGPTINPATGRPHELLLAMRRCLPGVVSEAFDKLLERCGARIVRVEILLGQYMYYVGFTTLEEASTHWRTFWDTVREFMPVDCVHELKATATA